MMAQYKRLKKLVLVLAMMAVPCVSIAAPPEPPAQDPYQQAIQRLTNFDPQIRRQGAESLGQMRNTAAVPDLIKALKDSSPMVRSAAADSLGLMRTLAASKQIAALLETDPDPSVRQTCAIALGYIADREILPSLIKGIKDKHDGARFASINTLGILKDGRAVKPLADELKNPDSRMRSASAYALGLIEDRSAVPMLVVALKVSLSTSDLRDNTVAINVVKALGTIREPSVLPAIKPLLVHKEPGVRIVSAHTLFRLSDGSGVIVAREFLSDPDGGRRRIAVEVVGEYGNEKDLSRVKALLSDSETGVKRLAEQAVSKLAQRVPKKAPPPAKAKPSPSAPSKKPAPR